MMMLLQSESTSDNPNNVVQLRLDSKITIMQ